MLAIPDWLKDVRELFPRETVEVLERHALERYGMTELVTDADVLKKMEPSYELLKAVLSFRHLMAPKVLDVARTLVRQVVEDLRKRLAREVRQVLWGRINRQRRSPLKVARNLDWHRTIRANLKHYDRERKRLILQSLSFFSRVEHHLPWHIIMAVDCSGSMMDSVIHSAVMAGIFKGLPAVRVSLVAFDTAVVDLTEQADDPTEVLMSVQLGGGTDIAGALGYCETLVQSPTRTIVVVVTDFFEGGPPGLLPGVDQAAARGRGPRAGPGRARRRGQPHVRSPDGRAVRRRRRRGGRADSTEAGRMDGPGSLLTRLRAALAAFDDEALAALANKGLVRRARKDLETIRPKVLEPGDAAERLRVEVGDAVAELALPPAQSRCDCPASGICRHILAALIFVKESAVESGDAASDGNAVGVEPIATPVAASPVEEVLALDDEAIGKWAGKALVARVRKALALGLPVEFEEGDRVAARLPTRNVNCRWMPGCGPEGMICSCHEPGVCEHRVAVVLAFQAARGTRVLDDSVERLALAAAAGAPRSREEVLASVGSVVAEMVVAGALAAVASLGRAAADACRLGSRSGPAQARAAAARPGRRGRAGPGSRRPGRFREPAGPGCTGRGSAARAGPPADART